MTIACTAGGRPSTQHTLSDVSFLSVAGLLFVVSAAVTVVCCRSMSAMGGMPMPGGWTLSMTWMRMPGQTWPGVTAAFLGMWMVMMTAMMLPSLIPMLWQYRRAVVPTHRMQLAQLSVLVSLGYFCVWVAVGMLIFPLGAALAAIEIQQPLLARAVPFASATIVILVGAFQFTSWKSHYLACCRESSPPATTAWRHGLHLSMRCACCCGGLMVILLVIGVMDLRAMLAITTAVTAERLAPDGKQVARAIGVIVVVAGLSMIAQALYSVRSLYG
jgi:predicted metal-binding membrane protein